MRVRRSSWSRLVVFGVLPVLALLVTVAAACFRWEISSARAEQLARIGSVGAARDGSIALLSYTAATADKDLGAARDRLTGAFQDSYTQLTRNVVIPGAKQKSVSVTATVPAAASISANPSHAVVLVLVHQTTVVGSDHPTDTSSSVRVTLDYVGGRWLISGFDPI